MSIMWYIQWKRFFTVVVSALKLVGCKITSCESFLRFNNTRFVFNACIKRLYERPAGRDPALIRRIQRRRYWRFFFRRSLYDDESAFKLRWFAVRNKVEWDPRKPRLRSKILLRRLRATVPRFTRVISYKNVNLRFHSTKIYDIWHSLLLFGSTYWISIGTRKRKILILFSYCISIGYWKDSTIVKIFF